MSAMLMFFALQLFFILLLLAIQVYNIRYLIHWIVHATFSSGLTTNEMSKLWKSDGDLINVHVSKSTFQECLLFWTEK